MLELDSDEEEQLIAIEKLEQQEKQKKQKLSKGKEKVRDTGKAKGKEKVLAKGKEKVTDEGEEEKKERRPPRKEWDRVMGVEFQILPPMHFKPNTDIAHRNEWTRRGYQVKQVPLLDKFGKDGGQFEWVPVQDPLPQGFRAPVEWALHPEMEASNFRPIDPRDLEPGILERHIEGHWELNMKKLFEHYNWWDPRLREVLRMVKGKGRNQAVLHLLDCKDWANHTRRNYALSPHPPIEGSRVIGQEHRQEIFGYDSEEDVEIVKRRNARLSMFHFGPVLAEKLHKAREKAGLSTIEETQALAEGYLPAGSAAEGGTLGLLRQQEGQDLAAELGAERSLRDIEIERRVLAERQRDTLEETQSNLIDELQRLRARIQALEQQQAPRRGAEEQPGPGEGAGEEY